MNSRAKADELAKRPYMFLTSVDATTEDFPIYFARVLEVEGCFGQGATEEEARKDLRLAMVDYFESLIKDNIPIPEPARLPETSSDTGYQGTFSYTVENVNIIHELKPKYEVKQSDYFLSISIE